MDIEKYKGLNFKAFICKELCKGRIQIEDGVVYLCQDKKDGADCKDKLGFRYSWGMSNISSLEQINNSWAITNFEIVPRDPETYKDWQVGDKVLNLNIRTAKSAVKEVIFRSGEVVICKTIQNSAAGVYTCDELYQAGYRLILSDIEKSAIDEDVDKKSEWIPKHGEPVLVRNCYGDKWLLAVIITHDECCNKGNYEVTDGQASFWSTQCIPYNKETRHLLGTTKNCNQLNF